MAAEHPFQNLFETLGRLPLAHAEPVNRRAREVLQDLLTVPLDRTGRCILLRAPRAGHGKTHLLSRVQHQLSVTHEFIPLRAAAGSQIDAATTIDDVLSHLLRPLPTSGGLCALDLVARRLFATGLQPLVASGEVPCHDRESALTALRVRPIETFDFHHPGAVTAQWAHENFGVLGQRLATELSSRSRQPVREVAFWVDAMFRFASTSAENPARLRILSEVVRAGDPGETLMMQRVGALLGLLALLVRVVLVADDLEGFSTDDTAALKFAAFLCALRESVERLDVVVALNQDVWENAFLPRLSGGLIDRLSEVVVELEPLTESEMVALLESRVPGQGAQIFAGVDRVAAGTHARGLIRAAGVAWVRGPVVNEEPTIPAIPEVPALPLSAQLAALSPFAGYEDPIEDDENDPHDSVHAEDGALVPIVEVKSVEPPEAPASVVSPAVDSGEQAVRRGPPPVPGDVELMEHRSGEMPSASREVTPDAESTGGFQAEAVPPPSRDRVDDLLRQFRERYGRGGA